MSTASIYVRNSKAIGERNLSQAGMLDDCHALANQLGLQVVARHVDNGKSGAIRDRPEFAAWLDDAREGRAEVLISWAGDRLTREGVNVAGAILDVVEGKDVATGAVVRSPVRFVSFDDGLDSEHGDAFRWNFVIKAEVARAERERMRARSKATRRRMVEAGKWASGPAPYGTRLDPERRLEADPVESVVLRDVAHRLLRGESVRSVLGWMADQGLRTRRGNYWTRSGLATSLESETARKYILTLAESRALSERLHPRPGSRPPGGRPQKWLLSGFATCAGCGHKMTTSRDNQRNVTRYVCSTTASLAPCPARATIRADRVDAFVEEQYLEHWGDLFFWDEVVTVDGAEVDAAERAHDEAKAALLADLTDRNLAAAQQAQAALDDALAKPTIRRREIVQTDTYAEQWAKAKERIDPVTGEPAPDLQALARMVASGAAEITVARATSTKWDPSRIVITWRDEVE